ncbi:hypothetical protein LINPERPRIM_LOCUS14623 [Linum perenne]
MLQQCPLIYRRRGPDQDQHGTSAAAPAGEAMETEAVTVDEGTSNLPVVILRWFSENSPMWPDMVRSQVIFKRLTLERRRR